MPDATGQIEPESINLVTLFARIFHNPSVTERLTAWENTIFSLIIIAAITAFFYFTVKNLKQVPGRLQCLAETIAGGADDFICGILGPKGRRFTPFIGTLFIYITCMNLAGFIPLFRSPTSDWSTTLALAMCVFVYVQYVAFKELGFSGYMYKLAGEPRGFLKFTLIFPVMMFFMHIISELIKPISLSLRLRSNIWGDDMLMSVVSGFGLMGVPILVFSMAINLIAAIVQALVFCLLATIYFALVLGHDEEPLKEG